MDFALARGMRQIDGGTTDIDYPLFIYVGGTEIWRH